MSSETLYGVAEGNVGSDPFTSTHFLVQRLLSRINTASLVQVVSCTNDGGVSPVGFVDVQMLVNQVTATGQPVPGAAIYHLPYFRVQGGSSAIILDPVPGDVGVAVFAQHDLSTVKNTAAQGNPGSFRRFDLADGLYMGGFVNGAPNQYVQFMPNAGGITMVSPTAITAQAPQINLVGQVNQSGGSMNAASEVNTPQVNASTDVAVGPSGLSVINHNHPGVQTGSGNTGTMQT